LDKSGKILGKTYFRDPDVNKGFYSKKREGVSDVDPKVSSLKFFTLPFLFIAGYGAVRSNPREATQTSRD
jgi:hypothetical protein